MAPTTLIELIADLRRPALRVRTGIWLAPPGALGSEADEAARAGIDALDIRMPLLADLPEGRRFLGLTIDHIEELLDGVANAKGSSCVLIYNFDLLLAKLGYSDRQQLWQFLYSIFAYRPRALILAMPATATQLLPDENELNRWRNDSRLVG